MGAGSWCQENVTIYFHGYVSRRKVRLEDPLLMSGIVTSICRATAVFSSN